MKSTRILTQAQAESVYSAMCALESSGGTFFEFSFDGGITFSPYLPSGYGISVRRRTVELYASRAIFATAYGLKGSEPHSIFHTQGIGSLHRDQALAAA
jgi:hypothetical protein